MFVGRIFYIKNFNFAIPDLQKFGDCIDNIDSIDNIDKTECVFRFARKL